MTGLLEGETVRPPSAPSPSRCASRAPPPSSTARPTSRSATLNGADLDLATAARRPPAPPRPRRRQRAGRRASTTNTASGEGILRTVDPTDKLVYVWTSLEPDEARRLWACFDQPDLKAPHRFTVLAPSLDGHLQLGARHDRGRRAGRRPAVALPGHAPPVDVRRGRQCRALPRDPSAARRLRPRPLLPPVAGAPPRAGPRRAGHADPAGAGVLRRQVRHRRSRRRATTRSSCPTSAARWRTGAA